jgi:uncharacterized membrane protein
MIGRNWGWILATLAVAAVVHLASVMATPHIIMHLAMRGIARRGVNTMHFGKRPTAATRGVVRPSPDLLYASCVYDLDAAGGAVRVHASGMPHTYWSVSLFDDATNNFYVLNDRQAKNGNVDFLITARGTLDGDRAKLPVVRAPTRRGLVLIRTLIDDDAHVAAIDTARRKASCEPAG